MLTYGLQSGWISPMTKVLQSDVSPLDSPLSDAELSWIASTMCLSAVFGVSMYAYIADTYGRKFSIVAIAIPQAVSSFAIMISWYLNAKCYVQYVRNVFNK